MEHTQTEYIPMAMVFHPRKSKPTAAYQMENTQMVLLMEQAMEYQMVNQMEQLLMERQMVYQQMANIPMESKQRKDLKLQLHHQVQSLCTMDRRHLQRREITRNLTIFNKKPTFFFLLTTTTTDFIVHCDMRLDFKTEIYRLMLHIDRLAF